MAQLTPGAKFRLALKEEAPLQVMGTINANHALLAKRAGFRAIYLSGGGVAAEAVIRLPTLSGPARAERGPPRGKRFVVGQDAAFD